MLKNKFQIAAQFLEPFIPDVDERFWNFYRNTLPPISNGGEPLSIPFSFYKDGHEIASAEFHCMPSSLHLAQFSLRLVLEETGDFDWDTVRINGINRFSKEEIEAHRHQLMTNVKKAAHTKSYKDAFLTFMKDTASVFDPNSKSLQEMREEYESLQAAFTEALTYHVHEIKWTKRPPASGWRKLLFG